MLSQLVGLFFVMFINFKDEIRNENKFLETLDKHVLITQ